MKLLLYEWCCSGGLAGQEHGSDLESLFAEGRMMLEALAIDASRDASLEITALIDPAREITLPANVHVRLVPQDDEIGAIIAAAMQADWTLLVAPETDGILVDRVARVRATGSRLIASSPRFLAIASDKQLTVDALAAAGVPVPPGRCVAGCEPLPTGFHMPAVRKARSGAGCEGMQILSSRRSFSTVSTATRLEAFVPGIPVGVSCLCGSGDLETLPPMRQRFTDGERPRYLGSDPLADRVLAARAERLAQRAVAALERAAGGERAVGWVGVDMILGDRQDGRNDRVLEVNPRVTTSFIPHSRGASTSLVRSLIDRAALSREPTPLPRS